MQMDHTSWEEPVVVGDSRSNMVLRVFSYYGFIKKVFVNLTRMYHWINLFVSVLYLFYILIIKHFYLLNTKNSWLFSHFSFHDSQTHNAHPHMDLIVNRSSQIHSQPFTCNRFKYVHCYYGNGLERRLLMFKSITSMAIKCKIDCSH